MVPDKQLSLAIGKDGQNARLAARLTGWKLDIKGHAEWEVIRKEIEEALAQQKASEPDPIVEELAVEAEPAIQDPVPSVEETTVNETAEDAIIMAESEPPMSKEDEDAILEALILEEEQAEANDETEEGLSIDALDEFTIEDLEDMEALEDTGLDFPQLGQNAGLIRFAEDIVEEEERSGSSRRRGSGRGNNQRRSRGPAR